MPRRFFDISTDILKRIDEHCQNTYDDGHRNHLGASIIGDKCEAKSWFTFRWVYHHKYSGRMQRLFNTGHKEEARIIEWLRGSGFNVKNLDEYEKQFKISDCNGHFGGSIDGVIFIPKLNAWCLLECKSNKTGTDFKMLFDDAGFEIAKPKHWSQCCVYGYKLNLEYVVYICKNKDNDDLFIQVEKLDLNHGRELIEKANKIINSKIRPYRVAQTPAYFECKYCNFSDVCHKIGTPIEKNCRSCKFAEPVENAEWKCNKYNSILPKEFIPKGCNLWEGIM